jgi:glucose-1-phosphate cytidylyltransferase
VTADVPVVVLCGGRGTRLGGLGRDRPKPLVEVGARPILWHVMRMYAHHGYRRFVLCLGHRGSEVERYLHDPDQPPPGGWEIELIDTGAETGTGARIARVHEHVGAGTFAVSYADCVGDVDLAAELEFHRAHGATGTVTGVRARSPYGHLAVDGERVQSFDEKPYLADTWVSAGFFLFEPAFLDNVDRDAACVLETGPLGKLAAQDELRVFRHEGFWRGMDTPNDQAELDDRWWSSRAPWKTWTG